MNNTDWTLIDTETTGLSAPMFVVELAAQNMHGWEPKGEPFRRLLNQTADIPPEASRVHGYTREILERDGDPAVAVYRDFSLYVGGRPIVSYNLDYDLVEVSSRNGCDLVSNESEPPGSALFVSHGCENARPSARRKL